MSLLLFFTGARTHLGFPSGKVRKVKLTKEKTPRQQWQDILNERAEELRRAELALQRERDEARQARSDRLLAEQAARELARETAYAEALSALNDTIRDHLLSSASSAGGLASVMQSAGLNAMAVRALQAEMERQEEEEAIALLLS